MRKLFLFLLLLLLSIGIISARQLKNDKTPDLRDKESKASHSLSSAPSSACSHPLAADTAVKREKTPVRYNENKIPSLKQSYSVPISTKTDYNPAAGNNYESVKRDFMKQSGYPDGRPGYQVTLIKPVKKGGCICAINMRWSKTKPK